VGRPVGLRFSGRHVELTQASRLAPLDADPERGLSGDSLIGNSTS
jgi:hypothetical protein